MIHMSIFIQPGERTDMSETGVRIWMFRHGATKGNGERRFVGSTDEGITDGEKMRLAECGRRGTLHTKEGVILYPGRNVPLYVSPMLRCRETAECLFPGREQIPVSDFREISFGRFEYRNHEELGGDPEYQAYIDSGGTREFPGGECMADFSRRCTEAFESLDIQKESAFVVHFGTIMALLDRYSEPHRDYFEWRVQNGGGFRVLWNPGTKKMTDITELRA